MTTELTYLAYVAILTAALCDSLYCIASSN